MVGSLLMVWLGGSALACEDFDQQVEWAQEEVLLEVNARAARDALSAAEKALGCGPPRSGTAIARMFLVEGATAILEGDVGGAADAFVAAHRADPTTWIDALGPKLREQYDAAASAALGKGVIDVKAGDWEVWLDGQPATLPADVEAGLHVLQVHDGEESAFGRVLWVTAGEEQVVDVLLPARKAAPEPVAAAPEPEPAGGGLALSAGIGASAAFGQALSGVRADGASLTEPGAKITLPVEIGLVVPLGDLWIRPTVGVAPLVGGRFLWAGEDGAASSFVAWLGDVAVGADLGAVHAGGMVGIAYPGRIGVRALAGLPVGDSPFFAEVRLGANVATAGRLEPAAGLAVSARVP